MGRPISIPEHFVKIELPQILADSEPEDEVSVQFFAATMQVYKNLLEDWVPNKLQNPLPDNDRCL